MPKIQVIAVVQGQILVNGMKEDRERVGTPLASTLSRSSGNTYIVTYHQYHKLLPPTEIILPEMIFSHVHVSESLFPDTQHGSCHRKRGVLHGDTPGYTGQLPGAMSGCSVVVWRKAAQLAQFTSN